MRVVPLTMAGAALRAKTSAAALLAPLVIRFRERGVVRAAPVSLSVAVLSLAATAAVRLATPLRHDAVAAFAYRGTDLFYGRLWRLPLSALLAQSWWQWMWTLLMALSVFAVLEARIGRGLFVLCLALSHCLPTVAIDLRAALADDAGQLHGADFGTSCLVVGAAAALAWQARSAVLAVTALLGLGGDLFFNSPATIAEHVLAGVVGVLVVATRSGPRRSCPPGPRSGAAGTLDSRARQVWESGGGSQGGGGVGCR